MGITIKTTGLDDYLDGGKGRIKALILGEPGVGKTRSASFWPAPILADCEQGRMSVADRSIPYVQIDKAADMHALLDELDRESKKPESMRKYKTLIIDTIDAYQRVVTQERLIQENKDEFSGWGDWGYLEAAMNSLVARLHKLDMNIVMNCHVKTVQTGKDAPAMYVPKLKGDFQSQISGDFDWVGHMQQRQIGVDGQRETQRYIRWKPDNRTAVIKDRSGRLPAETLVNFDDNDYLNLFVPIAQYLDSLREGETIQHIETPQPAPADTPGGPVQPKPEQINQTPKAKPVKKSGTKTEQPKPVAEAGDKKEQTETQAVELVQKELGGQVQEPVGSTPAVAETKKKGTAPVCGTAGKLRNSQEINPNPVAGCGKSLEKEDKALVNIALIKTRTLLCQDCLKKHTA